MNRAHGSIVAKLGIALSPSVQCARSAVLMLVLGTSLGLGGTPRAVADTKVRGALTEDQQILHLLNRLGYGPRPGDIERVKRIGLERYIDRQLHPEHIDDAAIEARLVGLESLRMTTAEIAEKYPAPQMVARELGLRLPADAKPEAKSVEPSSPQQGSQADDMEGRRQQREVRQQILAYYAEHGLNLPRRLLQELQAQKFMRAVYSERQLLEVMTDFWFNHFNVFWGKGADKWLTTDFEMHAIRPHALGKFQDLLLVTAKSPAMLFYLDNFLSSSPDAHMPDRAGQNRPFLERPRRFAVWRDAPWRGMGSPIGGTSAFKREQMAANPSDQPFANELRKRQPGINENYARELMELHTMGVDGGYTQQDVQEVARCFTGWTIDQPRQGANFVFRGWMHDDGDKVVLGHKIPAGGGIKDGEMVIDILAQHPSTARFISIKLARRFVSDNPPQALIDKLTTIYMKTDGDIRDMLRTIFTGPEFYAPEAYRAKIKSPFELATSAIRALDGDTDGSPRLAQFVAKMGQPLYQYQPPSGFPDRAEQWVNTGALLERLNFGLALSANRIPGTIVEPARVAAGIDSTQGARLMARAIDILLHGDVSPHTRSVLDRQLTEDLPGRGEWGGEAGGRGWGGEGHAGAAGPPVDAQVAKAFGLVLGAPEFQRR
jgi:uncharacterized protein (DUF1800 family)